MALGVSSHVDLLPNSPLPTSGARYLPKTVDWI